MRLDRWITRDVARVALQTAVAAAATALVVRAIGLDEVSFAVISALFTIRFNSDSTLRSGANRIVSALVGTLIGLAVVLAYPGAYHALGGLVIACALASVVTTLRPRYDYTVVPAAIIALDLGADVGEALEQALAIMIGALIGVAATLVVWPETGRARALRFLADALDDCRRLLEAGFKGLVGADGESGRAVAADFTRHIAYARQVAGETRYKPRLSSGRSLVDAVAAVERLWNTLVILDRIGEERIDDFSGDDVARVHDRLADLSAATSEHLSRLVDFMASRTQTPPDFGAIVREIAEVEEAMEAPPRFAQADALDESGRAILALRFALDELRRVLGELAALVEAERDPSP